jgi:beta-ureidopropionase / N-carbamoyl-L-amino-acid hydrolase
MIWSDGRVTGRESHAGSTPMPLRHDALCAFAEFALAVERIARAEGPDGVGTIGVAEILPASRNTIPGEVAFTLDLRHPDGAALKRMSAAVAAAADIGRTRGVEIALTQIWRKDPVIFDATVTAAIGDAADALALSRRPITSGAGHDAVLTAAVTPSAMIFVPCKDGLSHNEAESATPEDCAAGANVLLHTILALSAAGEPERR